MKNRARVVRSLLARHVRVVGELHPDLARAVRKIVVMTEARLTPWEGYRSPEDQVKRKAEGVSNAGPGQSPHNFRPALACDLVLNPSRVNVRAHPKDPETPDLWDDETPEALAAWEALDAAAKELGLERVTVGGRLDRPHVQLRRWRSLLPQ